ncbi:hypothetical protein CH249_09980 [Rhodococcus sp. 05-2255-3B1]|uniref:MazG nucleotide pyrophosphohydrolase domain-containing protein n=1 Tax=unclassified Rhodococcus (in: high G+C Gram-positive bacteria) TaxID=192944 RepID=UPI000B9B1432|nr:MULTISPECIES: MazG nucleotide pyrophosphohydrolase domain-containing protein [unclassified Rhodococcus (in: high G+C Gram-positive bacteria)]OZE05146.1 hypothetical protein CH250_20295 [Rhodococcus sp. 05-2255-3C]OZE11786.1 hypothetical protein CH249_09980 [Rhodococcus sp. 05-2255-3B1]OZE24193.1 hypothetical protein CH255_02485 [Rhodococcus sp. 05-2255-2A2]
MDFTQYQDRVHSLAARNPSESHELLPMLGLGAHVGAVLLTHQRYLVNSLAAQTSRLVVMRELGLILRWAALLAGLNDLKLDDVAYQNLVKIDRRARRSGAPAINLLPEAGDSLDMDTYQRLAEKTDQQVSDGSDPLSLSIPMLGLAGEVGNLLVEMKKRFRGDSSIDKWGDFVAEELGDLLWYVATVARHRGLSLAEVASGDLSNLARSAKPTVGEVSAIGQAFDEDFPGTERFPRQIHLHFRERISEGQSIVSVTLLDARPNAFPDGPVRRGEGKVQGFRVGEALGNEVTDNSRRNDAYRYHDAIHLGFLAVLGWSPNLRALLNVKRKSEPVVEETEDGARAIFAEEGLAAILAKQSSKSKHFVEPSLVPDELLDLVNNVVEDLEVGILPHWIWRDAVSQGFTVMQQLADGAGGYVLADLDKRQLLYAKLPFHLR